MEQLPTLTGDRVQLRWLVPEDTPAIYSIFADPRVTNTMGIDTRRDSAHALELIEEIHQLAHADTLYQWGIAKLHTNEVIGTVTLACIDPKNRRAEIGFALGVAHQGQGFATEAVELCLKYAFGPMQLHRIEADVDPDNAPSIALLQRLGFEREGYLRQRWLINGRWHDTVFFGLLAPG